MIFLPPISRLLEISEEKLFVLDMTTIVGLYTAVVGLYLLPSGILFDELCLR